MQTALKKKPEFKIKSASRDISLDAVKFFAIIGVLFIHSCNYFYPINSAAWTTNIFLSSVLRCAVPLFLMCSGALLLNPKKQITFKSLFTKYLLRLVIAMFFWAAFYKVFDLYFQNNLSYQSLVKAAKEVLKFDHKFHMYYMHIIILVYVLLPVTKVLVNNMNKKELLYTLMVWFLTGIIIPTFISLNFLMPFEHIYNLYSVKMAYAAAGYCILGYFLKTYRQNNFFYTVCAAAGFLIIFSGTVLCSLKYNFLYTEFFNGFSLGVFLSAVGIFGILNNVKSFGIFNGLITYISKASFCIYLVHVAFLNFTDFGLFLKFPQIIAVPSKVFINLVLSTAVYFVISKIPVAKKYII